jgi:nucleotide-binding universal stress UspA family protein
MQDGLRTAEIKTILAPTDLSPASLPGVLGAAEMAQRLRANLILMTVIPKPRATDEAHGRYLDQAEETVRMQLTSWFAHRVPLTGQGLSVRCLAIFGTPADAILGAARTEAVDLIVMTTHGRAGLTRLLHGSVAEAVVRASPSPVLTIRTDETPAKRAVAA